MTDAAPTTKILHHALVLPGAVARGAFEAGVIDVLTVNDVQIDRIVATSSGAINGVVYAAALRAGIEKQVIPKLLNAWIEMGSWGNSLSFHPLDWIRGRGLSNGDGLLKMMRNLVTPFENSLKRDVELRIIVAPLNGVCGHIGKMPATTFEKALHFANEDFDNAESLEVIFKAVTAACAFPGLFVPVELDGLGPCMDGGAVNNAPIAYALSEADVERVMVAVPFPAMMKQARSLTGMGLATHISEVLINERLYRDMNQAERRNRRARELKEVFEKNNIAQGEQEQILKVLGLREVELIQIRPSQMVKQSAFSGFFKKADRRMLIEEGREAARITLAIQSPKLEDTKKD